MKQANPSRIAAVATRMPRKVMRVKPSRSFMPQSLSWAVALAWLSWQTAATAQNLPQGGQAVVGGATFQTNGQTLNVTTTNGANNSSTINWQSFNIGAGHTTQINQPNAASTSLNRVVTSEPSAIFGTLQSNGQVILVNQNGIAVGRGGVVDTAGFTASTLNISDADYAAGKLRFNGNALSGGVQIDGTLRSANGDITLIAPNIAVGSDALVKAANGNVRLAAGQEVEITGRGLEGVKFIVQSKDNSATNLGQLQGNAVGLFAGTLKHSGSINAQTATLEGGQIVLRALGDTLVSGNIDASGAQGAGGSVDVLGDRVGLLAGASVNVSGQTSGGNVRIGGDYQGKNSAVQNARFTHLDAAASISADAAQSGNGGKVIVWADNSTVSYGSINARGGAQNGDGGFVEVSGKGHLDFGSQVDTRAANGKTGTLLLDPLNIVVQLTGGGFPLGTQILFSDNLGNDSILAVASINNAKTDVVLQATNNVTVNAEINIAQTGVGLSVSADNNIFVNKNITTNAGNITLQAKNGITTTGSEIKSNTGTINLEVFSANPGSIAVGALNSGGGAITVRNLRSSPTGIGGDISFSSPVFSKGAAGADGNIEISAGKINLLTTSNIDAGAGNVTLTTNSSDGITIGAPPPPPAPAPPAAADIRGKNISFVTDKFAIQNNAAVIATDRVILRPSTAANTISLGAVDDVAILGLSQAELNQISAPVLQIGDATNFAGNITIDSTTQRNGNLSLQTGPNGLIDQKVGAALNVTGSLYLNAGQISLNKADNTIAAFVGKTTKVSGGDFLINASNGVNPVILQSNIIDDPINGRGIISTGGITINNSNVNSTSLLRFQYSDGIKANGNINITGYSGIELGNVDHVIDSNNRAGNTGKAGNINLGNTPITTNNAARGLILDASSADAAGGNITFGSVSNTAGITLNGLTVNSSGSISNGTIDLVNGDINVGTGGVTLNGKVALSNFTNIKTADSNVVISGTVDGPQKLTIDSGAGDVTIFAPMGSKSAVAELKVSGKNITVNSINALDATPSGTVITLNATQNLTVQSGSAINAATAASAPAPAPPNSPASIKMLAGGNISLNGDSIRADGSISLNAGNQMTIDSTLGAGLQIQAVAQNQLNISANKILQVTNPIPGVSVELTSTNDNITMGAGSQIVLSGSSNNNSDVVLTAANGTVRLGSIVRDGGFTFNTSVNATVTAKNGISSAVAGSVNFNNIEKITLNATGVESQIGGNVAGKAITISTTLPNNVTLDAKAGKSIYVDGTSNALQIDIARAETNPTAETVNNLNGEIVITSQGGIDVLASGFGVNAKNSASGRVLLSNNSVSGVLRVHNTVSASGLGNLELESLSPGGILLEGTTALPVSLTADSGNVLIKASNGKIDSRYAIVSSNKASVRLEASEIDLLGSSLRAKNNPNLSTASVSLITDTLNATDRTNQIDAGTGTVTITGLTNGRKIAIVNDDAVAPSDYLLINKDRFTNGLVFGTLEIGNNGTGINPGSTAKSGDVLLVSGLNAPTTSVVKIFTVGAITSDPVANETKAGTLLLEAGGDITVQTNAAILGAKSTSGNIDLQINYIDGNGQGTKFSNLSTAAGKYARITSPVVAGATIGQTQAIVTAGWIDVVGNSSNLKWDNAGNNFGQGVRVGGAMGEVVLSSGNTPLRVSGVANNFNLTGSDVVLGTNLGNTFLSGNLEANTKLAVNSNSNITQQANTKIISTGLSSFTTAAGGNLVLTGADNVLSDVTLSVGKDASLTSQGTTLLQGNVAGNLSLTNTVNGIGLGSVGQSGALDVGGSTKMLALGQNITLDNAANRIGLFDAQGKDVTIVSAKVLDLNANLSGNLIVNSNAGITQGSNRSIVATSLVADSLQGSINLVGSNQLGIVAASAKNIININDVGDNLSINNLSATSVSLTSAGAITQAGLSPSIQAGSIDVTGKSIGSSTRNLQLINPNPNSGVQQVRLRTTNGDLFVENSSKSNLNALNVNGNASYNASDFTQLSGNISATGQLLVNSSGLSVDAATVQANRVILSAGAGDLAIGQAGSSRVSINGIGFTNLSGNKISISGGSNLGAFAAVGSSKGAVSINANTSFTLQGGIGGGAYASIGAAGPVTVTAPVVNIQGGSGQGAYAKLDPTNPGATLNIDATAVNVTGGTGPGAYASIESNGNIIFNPAGTLTLLQGAGLDSDAVVLSYQGVVTPPTSCNGCAILTSNNVLGNGVTNQGLFGVTPPPPPPPPPAPPAPAPAAPVVSVDDGVVAGQIALNTLINPPPRGRDDILVEGEICR